MATRSRKALFIQYRNSYSKNTINTTQINIAQNSTNYDSNEDDYETMGLINKNSPIKNPMNTSDYLELKQNMIPMQNMQSLQSLPPIWMDFVDEINESVELISKEINILTEMHKKHLIPNFENKEEEELLINSKTDEITQSIVNCQRKIQEMNSTSEGTQVDKLKRNIQISLATKVQDISSTFRKAQSIYLSKLKNIESKMNSNLISTDSTIQDQNNEFKDDDDDVFNLYNSSDQLQLMETTDQIASTREKEINEIAKSINGLLIIFKELQTMVIDQGTILDRIDYNIEQVNTNMEESVVQLTKATKYQKKTQKKMIVCFLILLIILILYIFIIIIKNWSNGSEKDNNNNNNKDGTNDNLRLN